MNNRQSGRRRGRNNNSNNNRSQSGGRGGVDQANRIDSRARGNGAQMIEKYRNLARDAQLAGDRVQTEYYLQFADHYFRVVSDFRARQEEKAAQNGQERNHDRGREIRGVEDFDGHDDSDLDSDNENDRGNDRGDRGERNDRSDRGERNDRGDRSEGDNDGEGRRGRGRRDADDNRGERQPRGRGRREREQDRDADAEGSESADAGRESETAEAPAPRAARRGPRRTRVQDGDEGGSGIDSAALPPAIGRTERSADEAGDAVEEKPAAKPRRTRRTLAARDTDAGVEAAE
ncbi:MAG: DUF4167 domain-containing protein [Sphingopyxis sp.]|uniref:DUF4167 domain-containing protein n=1 Tax=Sphingopyxis sp. TaxID=1908224 RepID=UPI002AB92357|nr:DUF4167 domain-containing protein [Sphingopyxis sp.]MDZ3832426.1 DUF4167 domain-containing protein [Sphingopyxis sp.]